MSDYRLIEEPIFWRRSRSVAFTPTPPPDKPEPVLRISPAREHRDRRHVNTGIAGVNTGIAGT